MSSQKERELDLTDRTICCFVGSKVSESVVIRKYWLLAIFTTILAAQKNLKNTSANNFLVTKKTPSIAKQARIDQRDHKF
jgi:hypothetical protein